MNAPERAGSVEIDVTAEVAALVLLVEVLLANFMNSLPDEQAQDAFAAEILAASKRLERLGREHSEADAALWSDFAVRCQERIKTRIVAAQARMRFGG